MKILVTGAGGYLGTGIVKSLLDAGHEVIATDFSLKNTDRRAQNIECNLFTIESPYEFFEKPEVLLHLAWKDGFVHNSDAHICELPKHYRFIEKMSKSAINTIAVMGTMHEIGYYEGSIDESTPCNPENFYGVAKNALRKITELFCHQNGKVFQWLRGYYIVGNSEYGSSIFSKITAAEKNAQKTFLFTMGLNQFDFIDYEVFL